MLRLLAILIMSTISLGANAQVSPWTGEAYPELITNAPEGITYGFDSQVGDRSALHWMEYIDWEKIQDKLFNSESEHMNSVSRKFITEVYSKDYISNESILAEIKALDPDLYDSLTRGLDLTKQKLLESDKGSLITTVTAATSELILTGRPSQETELLTEQNTSKLIGLEQPRLQLLERPTWQGNSDTHQTSESDWVFLNRRWNALSWEEKVNIFDLSKASKKKQVSMLRESHIMKRLGFDAKDEKNFFSEYGLTLPESFSNITMGPEGYQGWSDRFYQGLEFRMSEPMTDSVAFLDLLYGFNKKSNRLYYIQNPMERGTSIDGDFHLHFGTTPELKSSLYSITRAWNHLSVLKDIDDGNTAWVDPTGESEATYQQDIGRRGYVRLITNNHMEIRTQFYDPETTIKHLNHLVTMTDGDAVKYIYEELAPKVTPDHIMEIARRAPDLLLDLMMDSLFLNVIDFRIKETIKPRLIKYIDEKFYNGEFIALSPFSFLLNDAEMLSSYIDLADSFSEFDMDRKIEILALASLYKTTSFLDLISLEDTIEVLDAMLKRKLPIYGFSFLIQKHFEPILEWHAKRENQSSEDLRFHSVLIDVILIGARLSDDELLLNKVLKALTPLQLAFAFQTNFNAAFKDEIDLRALYSNDKLAEAISLYVDGENRRKKHDIRTEFFIGYWLKKSTTLQRLYFLEIEKRQLNLHGRVSVYLIESQLDESKKDYAKMYTEYLSYKARPINRTKSLINKVWTSVTPSNAARSCRSLL